MTTLETTKMSSRGQVVIPEEIRKKLGLRSGTRFLVVGDKDVVVLKTIAAPRMDQFDDLVRNARRQARKAGVKRPDIARAVAKSRERT